MVAPESLFELWLRTTSKSRWREVQTPLQDLRVSGEQAALHALDKLEAATVQLQRATAQPKPRHYELTPD